MNLYKKIVRYGDEYRGYYDAYIDWCEENHPDLEHFEKNDDYRYLRQEAYVKIISPKKESVPLYKKLIRYYYIDCYNEHNYLTDWIEYKGREFEYEMRQKAPGGNLKKYERFEKI